MSAADFAEDDAFIDECLRNAPPAIVLLPLGRRVVCHNCGHGQHGATTCLVDPCACRSSLHAGRVR